VFIPRPANDVQTSQRDAMTSVRYSLISEVEVRAHADGFLPEFLTVNHNIILLGYNNTERPIQCATEFFLRE
jgi:hypothetical protein